MSDSMDVPASWNRFRLSAYRAFRKYCRTCLTSIALALPDLWSAARMSSSRQVSWEIHYARAVVGKFVLSTPLWILQTLPLHLSVVTLFEA